MLDWKKCDKGKTHIALTDRYDIEICKHRVKHQYSTYSHLDSTSIQVAYYIYIKDRLYGHALTHEFLEPPTNIRAAKIRAEEIIEKRK